MINSVVREISFEGLSNFERNMLYLILILNQDGVAMRDLLAVLACTAKELSDLNQKLADSKLMVVCGDRLVAPIEVRQAVMMNETPPMDMVNETIKRISSLLMPAVYKSSKEQKPFYDMAENVIKLFLRNEPIQDLNWSSFSELVCNFAVQFQMFGHPEDIKDKSDLMVIKALRLSRQHVMHDSDLMARLMLLEASLFIEGFFFGQARTLIEDAENIMHTKGLDKDNQVLFLLVKGLYHLTYGENLVALSCFSMGYEICQWPDFYRSLFVCLIVKELAEIEEFESAKMWIKRLDERFIADNEIKFYLHLIHGLLEKDDNKAEVEFYKAKDIIHPEAPICAQYYTSRSAFFANRMLIRRSEEEYKKSLKIKERFGSTDDGYFLLRGSEVIRMVSAYNELTAKQLTICLDDLNLNSKESSVGVRLLVIEAYCEYHLKIGSTLLAKTYAEMGLELLDENSMEEEILRAASKVFQNGRIPVHFTEQKYYFHEVILKADLKECQSKLVRLGEEGKYNVIYKDVRRQIKDLKREMVTHKDELTLLSAHILSFTKPHLAFKIMSKVVKKAHGIKRILLAIISSNYLTQIGFRWEAKDILCLGMKDRVFEDLNKGIRATYLLQLATITEDVDLRGDAHTLWENLVELAQDSELLSEVYFSRAVSAYLHDSNIEAGLHICSCISCYKPEDWLHDESLAGYWSYQSVILSQSNRFIDSKSAILRAMEEWPDLKSPSAFNLFYNLAFYCMGLEDYVGAREALQNAKNLKLDEQQKNDLKGLYEILALPREERKKYFENPNGVNEETEDIIDY